MSCSKSSRTGRANPAPNAPRSTSRATRAHNPLGAARESWDDRRTMTELTHEDMIDEDPSTGELELEERASLRRVAGLSTELEDVTEVEYRQLRLENVVLIGVFSRGSPEDAEDSM